MSKGNGNQPSSSSIGAGSGKVNNQLPSLRVRTEQAEMFLTELGRGIPADQRVMIGYAPEVTGKTDPETGKNIHAGWWPMPWKPGKGLTPGRNSYVVVSSCVKTPHPKTGELRYWRDSASFGSGLAVMVDDIGYGIGSKGTLTLEYFESVLPPTAVIATSPGNFQLWYFLDKPEPNVNRFKPFLRAFIKDVVVVNGGDGTSGDIMRYGRMPYGINNKKLADGSLKYPVDGKPWEVRFHSQPDYSRRYSIEQIRKAFGFTFKISKPRPPKVIEQDSGMDALWLRMAVRLLNETQSGESTGGAVEANASGAYRIRCPWGHEHLNGDPFGAYFRGPKDGQALNYVFGCSHDTCRKDNKRWWGEFVDEVVMPHIEMLLDIANENAPNNLTQLFEGVVA